MYGNKEVKHKMFYDQVPKSKNNTYVFAYHSGSDKEYVWKVPKKINVEVSFNVGSAEFDTKKMVYVVDADALKIYYDNDECYKELVDCAKQTEVDYLAITRVPSKNIHYLV